MIWQFGILGCGWQNETVSGFAEMEVVSNRVIWNSVRSGFDSADFTPNPYNAQLNITNSVSCDVGANGNPFTVTVSFTLPHGAESIEPEPATFASTPEDPQFRLNDYNEPQANFVTRQGTWSLRMRRVSTAGPNSVRLNLGGKLRTGGAYSGVATIKFSCQ